MQFATHPEASPLNIVMLDFESTDLGSSPNFHPLELAARVVNQDLAVIGSFGPRLFKAPSHTLESMNPYTLDMHTKTGLLDRLKSEATFTAEQMDHLFAGFIAQFFPSKGEALPDGSAFRGIQIGGNSLSGVDLPAIRRFMPLTQSLLDYRTVDVSSIHEGLRRIMPAALENMPAKESDHTALKDIDECIKELRFYRSAISSKNATA